MKCETCKFYDNHGDGVGYCRRYPKIGSVLIEVFTDDWCGEYKVNES
jgi:hypothetical protein